MDSRESLARSLSAIHKGNGKRKLSRRESTCGYNLAYESLKFLDTPPLPFGFEDNDATAFDVNKPSSLQHRSNYSNSRPQDSTAKFPRQKTFLQKSRAPAATDRQRGSYFSKPTSFICHEDSSKLEEKTLRAVQARRQGNEDEKEKERCYHRGFRTDYVLGAAARSSSHMVVEACKENAFKAISSMKEHDFAFIRRSDGQWTYSILAYRSFETIRNNTEECMTFVTSDAGATKMVKKSQWATSIRLVSNLCPSTEQSGSGSFVEVEVKPQVSSESKKVEEKAVATKGKASWVPKSVSFPRHFDDEVSIISNVSTPKLARSSYYKPAKQSPLKSY